MSLLGSHPSCLFVFYPFLLLSLWVHPESSPLVSLRQSMYIDLRLGKSSSPHFDLKATGFNLSSLHTITAHVFTFAVTLHFLVSSSAFSICSCNSSAIHGCNISSSNNASKKHAAGESRGLPGWVSIRKAVELTAEAYLKYFHE